MIWSAEDVARATVRRQAPGLDAGQVAGKVAEAARRERETRQQLHAPVRGGKLVPDDPVRLAESWAARHPEWQRVAALMEREGWPVYLPERDVQGSEWERDREARRQAATAHHAAWAQEQRDARDELRAQVWLSAEVSRRLRAITRATGLSAEQLLAQLADQVRLNDDGTLTADPSTPR
ncbi:hypothetical protein [Streptomyces aquilus]|uniref:hypothetical protein n=1 Tax=Streptomyces aquilus TaxID=2548456 RepID=UPI003677069A